MQILPNGNVLIQNKVTGESREVSPNDLGRYNIPFSAYESMRDSSTNQQLKANQLESSNLEIAKQKAQVNVNPSKYLPAQDTTTANTTSNPASQGQTIKLSDVMNGGGKAIVPNPTASQSVVQQNNQQAQVPPVQASPEVQKSKGLIESAADVLGLGGAYKYLSNLGTIGGNTIGQIGDIYTGAMSTDNDRKKAAGADFIAKQKQNNQAAKDLGFDKGSYVPTTETMGKAGKAALQIASYGVNPGSGVVGLAKSGAIAGAANAAGQDNATVGSIVAGGITGGVTGGTMAGAGKVLSKTGNMLQTGGKAIRNNVSQIFLRPSVWGSQQEEAVQNTLNKLGINGSAAQKYAQLAPKFQQLGDKISEELTNNPQTVNIGQLKNDFLTNLQDAIRSNQLTTKTAQKEVRGYLSSIMNASSSDGIIPEEVSTADLFKLKQQVNKDYQGVIKKIQSNTPLNDREKVIAVARQTLDDAISSKNPKVKDYTIMQSHLYDAAEPLNDARKGSSGVELLGTKLPNTIVQPIVDRTGRIIGKAGDIVNGVSGVSNTVSPIANRTIPPIVSRLSQQFTSSPQDDSTQSNNSNPFINAEQNSQNEQGGSYNNGGQNNTQSNTNHNSTIPQIKTSGQGTISYVTGYSPQQLMQSQQKAYQDGDPMTAEAIGKLYDKEVAYQKANNRIPRPLTSEQTRAVNLAENGLRGLDIIKQQLVDPKTGNIKMDKFNQYKLIPFGLGNRLLDKAIFDAFGSRLRIETGAQANESEIKKYIDKYFGQIGDSPEAIRYAINNLDMYLKATRDQQGALVEPQMAQSQ